MSPERIQVLVADDHPPVRAGVRALLELEDDIEVIAEVSNSEEVIRAGADLQPDVIMMDLRMPGVGGVEATRVIVQQSPRIAVLVLTMVEDGDSIFAALRAGARGYLLKEAGATRVAACGAGRRRRRLHHQPGSRDPGDPVLRRHRSGAPGRRVPGPD